MSWAVARDRLARGAAVCGAVCLCTPHWWLSFGEGEDEEWKIPGSTDRLAEPGEAPKPTLRGLYRTLTTNYPREEVTITQFLAPLPVLFAPAWIYACLASEPNPLPRPERLRLTKNRSALILSLMAFDLLSFWGRKRRYGLESWWDWAREDSEPEESSAWWWWHRGKTPARKPTLQQVHRVKGEWERRERLVNQVLAPTTVAVLSITVPGARYLFLPVLVWKFALHAILFSLERPLRKSCGKSFSALFQDLAAAEGEAVAWERLTSAHPSPVFHWSDYNTDWTGWERFTPEQLEGMRVAVTQHWGRAPGLPHPNPPDYKSHDYPLLQKILC